MNPLKAIKIAMLKRQTVELYGKVKYYTKKVRGWENQLTAYSITSSKMKMTDREFNELQGSIALFSKKIVTWKKDFESNKLELESLGVKVELTV